MGCLALPSKLLVARQRENSGVVYLFDYESPSEPSPVFTFTCGKYFKLGILVVRICVLLLGCVLGLLGCLPAVLADGKMTSIDI